MVLAAVTTFGASLFLLVVLFGLKRVEVNRGARFGEGLRTRADLGALRIKRLLAMSEWYLEQAPFFLAALTRYGIHVGALSYARIARKSAESAHSLADLVSHKRGFQRRETKSQYLRDVSEVRNGKPTDDTPVATL